MVRPLTIAVKRPSCNRVEYGQIHALLANMKIALDPFMHRRLSLTEVVRLAAQLGLRVPGAFAAGRFHAALYRTACR